MPSSLLRAWQENLAQVELDLDNKKLHLFNIWKQSYLKTCADVDQDLVNHSKIDAFYSGTTSLSIVRQQMSVTRALCWLPHQTMTAWLLCSLLSISSQVYQMRKSK